MSPTNDEILPEEPSGELVHWMEPRPMRVGPGGVSAAAVAAFGLGVAAAVGAMLLFRYLDPRRKTLSLWTWGRQGPLH